MVTQLPIGAQGMLLRTKLYIPPPRREQVPRPALIERLNAGLDRRLTLLSAPAGFGKTTLVSEWIASHRGGGARLERGGAVVAPGEREGARTAPLQVAWLSLDEGDNDLTYFLTYLVAALQTVETDIGKGVLSALGSPQSPPVEAILTSLINEIAAFPGRTEQHIGRPDVPFTGYVYVSMGRILRQWNQLEDAYRLTTWVKCSFD